MMESTALLICDDPALTETIHEVVRSIHKFRLRIVASIEELSSPHLRIPDAILLIHLPRGREGAWATRLLRMLMSARQSVPVIVLCDEHRPEQILELLRLGAADCLSRPLDLQRLSYLIDVLTVRARYTARTAASATAAPVVDNLSRDRLFLFVPKGAMGLLTEQVQRVAPQKTTVLLSGETGTGKTCLARVIHELSPRSSKPFLVINCGTLSANLIESELFGHVKGAFTGADRDRNGKFAEVGGGTLLLDEIDALPLTLQAKLLRVLEERVFEPVGSNRTCTMQARLIVASNRDLDREVAEGRFRADLYYRLNVVGFHLLPLRERRDTIVALAERFLADFAADNGRPVQGISDEARMALQEYNWPGNIRELRNVIERAVALCAGPLVEMLDLPEAMRRRAPERDVSVDAPSPVDSGVFSAGTLAETKDEAEYLRITTALRRHNNNRLRAAAELGISRMTLYTKLRRLGLFGAT
jgi:two-component system, NtrC family, response regulator HydG